VTDTLRWWSDPSTLLINQGRAGGYAFKNEFLDRGISYNEGDIDVGMVDFDNDGRMDLSVTREVKYETRPAFTNQEQKGWFGLFAQLPDGKFKSVGLASGINDREMKEPLLNRLKGTGSHSWSDIDRDGDMDLYVGGCGGAWRPNFLFENRIGSRQDWVGIKLRGDGKTVNRDAIGAKAVLKWPDGRQLMRTVKSSRGHYNSMDMQTLHFGLGDLGCDYRVEVTWPNGKVSRYTAEEVMRNRYVTLNYGDVAHEPPQPRLYLPRALRQGIGE
jgi:hypothetical protein